MNNLLSYCGLVDSRMRASEKDLPVQDHNSFYYTSLEQGVEFAKEKVAQDAFLL